MSHSGIAQSPGFGLLSHSVFHQQTLFFNFKVDEFDSGMTRDIPPEQIAFFVGLTFFSFSLN